MFNTRPVPSESMEVADYVTGEMCAVLEVRLKQIELEEAHRTAFIQDLSALKWRPIPSFKVSSTLYYAYVDRACAYYTRVHYVAGRPYLASVTTSEDPQFQYTITIDEAKRILGKAWSNDA